MATYEEALRFLEASGIENGDTGTPLDRVVITRRVITALHAALDILESGITWQTTLRDEEEAWEYIDYHIGQEFGITFAWTEATPETVGGLIREVERQYRDLWKRVVIDFEENPKRCGAQGAFYGVRSILRTLGEDANARWRPSDVFNEILPASNLIRFYRQVHGQFGVPLPLEWKVLGIFPYTFTWWTLWLLLCALIISTGFTGFFLTGLIALATFLLNVILGGISRYALPNHLYTLGDIARYIVAEQVNLRDSLKKAAGISASDSG